MKFKNIDLAAISHNILTNSRNELMAFGLNDGISFTLDKGELFDAINILTSNEFDDLVGAHNHYEEWRDKENVLYSQAIDNADKDTLYDLVHAAAMRGFYNGVIETITTRITDSAPYSAWYKARCLYEALTGIDRDLL